MKSRKIVETGVSDVSLRNAEVLNRGENSLTDALKILTEGMRKTDDIRNSENGKLLIPFPIEYKFKHEK